MHFQLMPRARPVVINVSSYRPAIEHENDATGLSRGVSRFIAFHSQISDVLADSVNLHRSSRWHPRGFLVISCSNQRDLTTGQARGIDSNAR